jgi:hypothetical protein
MRCPLDLISRKFGGCNHAIWRHASFPTNDRCAMPSRILAVSARIERASAGRSERSCFGVRRDRRHLPQSADELNSAERGGNAASLPAPCHHQGKSRLLRHHERCHARFGPYGTRPCNGACLVAGQSAMLRLREPRPCRSICLGYLHSPVRTSLRVGSSLFKGLTVACNPCLARDLRRF